MRHRIDGYTFAVVDLLTALVVVFAAMAVLSITAAKSKNGAIKGASIVITQYWQLSADADVDTWVLAPGAREAVGYRNMHGRYCDLVRDDLGRKADPESRNMETVICRGVPAGEMIVNSVLYHNYGSALPILIWITVQGRDGATILTARGELDYQGEEVTLARFSLDKRGAIVPGSVNRLPAHLFEEAQ